MKQVMITLYEIDELEDRFKNKAIENFKKQFIPERWYNGVESDFYNQVKQYGFKVHNLEFKTFFKQPELFEVLLIISDYSSFRKHIKLDLVKDIDFVREHEFTKEFPKSCVLNMLNGSLDVNEYYDYDNIDVDTLYELKERMEDAMNGFCEVFKKTLMEMVRSYYHSITSVEAIKKYCQENGLMLTCDGTFISC